MEEKINKNTTIRFRVSEDELKQIDNLCKFFKMSKSDFIRSVLLGRIDNTNFLLEMGNLPIIKQWHYVQEKLGYIDDNLNNRIKSIQDDLK
ncbi:plasmid mobilization protein [Campylobacterota bacterium DY0563]